jgi:hypothetical protein
VKNPESPAKPKTSRRLVHIPIVHAPEDLGSQFEAVRQAHLARYGIRSWQQHRAAVARYWGEIRQTVVRLPRPGRLIRIYQDGLPICGQETKLVCELAAAGSENHRLIVHLVAGGALLMGTEDPELLLQERRRWLQAGPSQPALDSSYDELMERRDVFIASRIGATLGPQPELGLLFLGALHRAMEKLAEDIQVIPISRSGRLI